MKNFILILLFPRCQSCHPRTMLHSLQLATDLKSKIFKKTLQKTKNTQKTMNMTVNLEVFSPYGIFFSVSLKYEHTIHLNSTRGEFLP